MQRIKEEVYIEALSTFLVLPKVFVGQFIAGDTTPSVKNVTVFKSPGSSTTVTNFDDGAEGQTIKILGNGNLTADDGTYIKCNTGADKVLAANKVYTFTLIDGVWYEGE